jgi:signal transduction histidine kinase
VTRRPALSTASQVHDRASDNVPTARTSELVRLGRRVDELEAELNRQAAANRALRRFVAEAAHEMTGPLVIAESSAMLLSEEFAEDVNPTLRARINWLGNVASRGRLLVEALLLDARAEEREPELTSVDLGELVSDALDLVGEQLRARSPQLAISPVPTVWSNRQFLSIIVRNLVVNAVKYGSPARHFRIEADREPTTWRLSVVSPGPVIGAKDAERLLRPFERGNEARRVAGTGLGLAICLRLAERLGGTVGYAPEPGVGNRFFVQLPAEPAATGASDEPPPAMAC